MRKYSKHGQKHTRLYKTWENMKQRCLNPKNTRYKNYGGRGITVCDEWMDFDPFYNWAILNGYDDELTIERRNNNLGYCPENCTWISWNDQRFNKENSIVVNYNGEELSLIEACKLSGVKYLSVISRKKVKATTYQKAFDHLVQYSKIKPKRKIPAEVDEFLGGEK